MPVLELENTGSLHLHHEIQSDTEETYKHINLESIKLLKWDKFDLL